MHPPPTSTPTTHPCAWHLGEEDATYRGEKGRLQLAGKSQLSKEGRASNAMHAPPRRRRQGRREEPRAGRPCRAVSVKLLGSCPFVPLFIHCVNIAKRRGVATALRQQSPAAAAAAPRPGEYSAETSTRRGSHRVTCLPARGSPALPVPTTGETASSAAPSLPSLPSLHLLHTRHKSLSLPSLTFQWTAKERLAESSIYTVTNGLAASSTQL